MADGTTEDFVTLTHSESVRTQRESDTLFSRSRADRAARKANSQDVLSRRSLEAGGARGGSAKYRAASD